MYSKQQECKRRNRKLRTPQNSDINIIQICTSPPMANLAPSVLKARHFWGPTDSRDGVSLGIMRTENSSKSSLNNLQFGQIIYDNEVMDLIRVCRKGQTIWNSEERSFQYQYNHINIIKTERNDTNVETKKCELARLTRKVRQNISSALQ